MTDSPKTTAIPDERAIRRCAVCSCDKLVPASSLIYEVARWRSAIMRATPPEVWKQYMADGYTLPQAVEMEMSYGG